MLYLSRYFTFHAYMRRLLHATQISAGATPWRFTPPLLLRRHMMLLQIRRHYTLHFEMPTCIHSHSTLCYAIAGGSRRLTLRY